MLENKRTILTRFWRLVDLKSKNWTSNKIEKSDRNEEMEMKMLKRDSSEKVLRDRVEQPNGHVFVQG